MKKNFYDKAVDSDIKRQEEITKLTTEQDFRKKINETRLKLFQGSVTAV